MILIWVTLVLVAGTAAGETSSPPSPTPGSSPGAPPVFRDGAITAVVVKSWIIDPSFLIWEHLNENWSLYGDVEIQISLRPGSFLTPAQYAASPEHRKRFEELLAWGAQPRPLTASEMEVFLRRVYDGLMSERRGRPAHSEAYIAWALSELRDMLKAFNKEAERPTDSEAW